MTVTENPPLMSFTLFNKLPPEIRLRIWDLNLPGSRIVPVYCGSDLTCRSDRPLTRRSSSCSTETSATQEVSSPISSYSHSPPGCSSPAAIPANLHVCSESRIHALGTRYNHSLAFARSPDGRVILDYDTDVLYFPPVPGYMATPAQFHTCMSLCNPSDLCRIRRVALHEDIFSGHLSRQPRKPCADGGSNDGYYWSELAVGLTTECLRLVRERMPNARDITIVYDVPADRSSDYLTRRELEHAKRLVAQIETAMTDLSRSAGLCWERCCQVDVRPWPTAKCAPEKKTTKHKKSRRT